MSYNIPPSNQSDLSWSNSKNYNFPSSSSSDLSWQTSSTNQDNYVFGHSVLSEISSSGLLSTTVFVTSDIYFSSEIESNSTIAFEVSVSGSCEFTSIISDSYVSFEVSVSGSCEFTSIISDSYVSFVPVLTSDYSFSNITSESVIDRGNNCKSHAYIRSKIKSNGQVLVVPTVLNSTTNIAGSIISESRIVAAVVEIGQHIKFSDGISHLRGRVLFGYPKAPIIRQVYEMSNNRSLTIPKAPEDPPYAVFLTTTDFNLTDEELRRGTVNIEFTFNHDAKDIIKISVYLKTPSGLVSLDKMKIFDYPGGRQDPHILYEPFRWSSVYNIPIHCISKKENQFFIEIDYKNPEADGVHGKPRFFKESEKYIIPFQAHFDNRIPYLNIADHNFTDGSKGSPNHYFKPVFETNYPDYCIPDTDINKAGLGTNPNTWYEKEFVLQTRIFLTIDDVYYISNNGTANVNTYFKQEYTDLSEIQIGG